jgi:hypothetical protein
MPRTYTSTEAFKEYSARIGYSADYREAMGVVQSAFSCLALTNEQVRELQSLAWSRHHTGGGVCMVLRVKGGAVFEITDRKEADAIRAAMLEYGNALIYGNTKQANKMRVEFMLHVKQISILCCKVDGFE